MYLEEAGTTPEARPLWALGQRHDVRIREGAPERMFADEKNLASCPSAQSRWKSAGNLSIVRGSALSQGIADIRDWRPLCSS